MDKHSYVFDPGNRSILAEIFLPKRISLQGTLYDTLEDGLNYQTVKDYLVENAGILKDDYLKAYAEWFDPTRYGYLDKPGFISSGEPAKDRMNRCKRVFFGWSTYEVKGSIIGTTDRKHTRQNTLFPLRTTSTFGLTTAAYLSSDSYFTSYGMKLLG